MLELGIFSDEGHKQVGREIATGQIDFFVAVGNQMRLAVDEAQKQGLSKENVFIFSNAEMAGRFVQDRISENDCILVKGSQGMRMEKIVKEIMAEPLRAKELLVRQDDGWVAN